MNFNEEYSREVKLLNNIFEIKTPTIAATIVGAKCAKQIQNILVFTPHNSVHFQELLFF